MRQALAPHETKLTSLIAGNLRLGSLPTGVKRGGSHAHCTILPLLLASSNLTPLCSFYLCATSLATKTPLPHELPSMVTTARAIQHDALILSGRLTRTGTGSLSLSVASSLTHSSEEGQDILRSQAFLRYWFYLCAFSSTSYLLESMCVCLQAVRERSLTPRSGFQGG